MLRISKTDATEADDTRMTSKAIVRAARHRVMIEQRYYPTKS